MLEKYKQLPFALIGIDSDGSRSVVLQNRKKYGLAWRIVIDGDQVRKGPISLKWNLNNKGWPIYYVIDQKGIIRAKVFYVDQMLNRVADLMKQVKR